MNPRQLAENRNQITLGCERKEKPPLQKREEKAGLFTSTERTPLISCGTVPVSYKEREKEREMGLSEGRL